MLAWSIQYQERGMFTGKACRSIGCKISSTLTQKHLFKVPFIVELVLSPAAIKYIYLASSKTRQVSVLSLALPEVVFLTLHQKDGPFCTTCEVFGGLRHGEEAFFLPKLHDAAVLRKKQTGSRYWWRPY